MHSEPHDRAAPHPRTILIVEDEPDSRALLSRLLIDAGYRVVAAGDANEALAIATAIAVDVLLTDLRLPQRRGDVLAEEVRLLQPAVRVIYVSGEAPSQPSGSDTYFEKPIDTDALIASIEATGSRPHRGAAMRVASGHGARRVTAGRL